MAYRSSPIDNAIALRLLAILCTPFEEFPAYKSGVIDGKGKYIVPKSKRTSAQKRSLTYLDKLMINIKKMINKLPGGENKLKNVVTAMVLVKECLEEETDGIMLTEQYVEAVSNDIDYESDETHDIVNLWCEYLKLREEMGSSAIVGGNTTSGIDFYSLPLSKDSIVRRNDFFKSWENYARH